MTGGLYENTRRQFSSNEDFTKKISHSVFVTNFPDYVNSRDLWNKCSVYGTVIDVFIPNKKSKAGKRFAFVRFIKVFNLDRLVKNLCTIWIGSYHLFANQVRYDRPQKPLNPNTNVPQKYGSKKDADHRNGSTGSHQKKGGVTSYVSVVNGVTPLVQPGNSLSSAPALVLDEECVVERDFSNCAMGRVKSFDSITKLQSLLVDEGFVNVTLSYLGGLWVMFECDKPDTKRNLVNHVGINSWFQVIQEVNPDFVSDERVVWLDIEGVPLYAWSRKSFDKIGNKWGEVLNIEDSYETSFGRKVYMVRAKELFTWTPSFESIKELDYSRRTNLFKRTTLVGEAILMGDYKRRLTNVEGRDLGWSLNLNEVLDWCKRKKRMRCFFKVDFARLMTRFVGDFLLDVLEALGFRFRLGVNWIRGIYVFVEASLLVNGSPSDEFHIHRGLKQGDPLSPFLFILVMEALHLSVCKAVDEDVFKGIQLTGINIHKSQILGVGVSRSRVEDMAYSLGCTIMENKVPLSWVMVGAGLTRHKAWDDVILKLQSRLSKWKAKTLSLGGRLTLVPACLEKKISWIAWDKVLASKKKGGLGVSSYFALNRALLLKWVWRFVSQDDSLWFRVIQAVHGDKIDSHSVRKVSIWSSILKEVQVLWSPRLFALDSAPIFVGRLRWLAPWIRLLGDQLEEGDYSNCKILRFKFVLYSVVLSTSNVRWYFSLSSSGEFCVKVNRLAIDDLVLRSI
ncbi:RNA-directed DNA polymerase, eukaryota, nucleotide-binding alpha-beta plait domain protein [Tanacetum coccineum]